MNTPRCNTHRDRLETSSPAPSTPFSPLATSCKPLRWILGRQSRRRTGKAILAELMAVDDEFLGVFSRGMLRSPSDDPRPDGWVRFVYGNDGWDVISDYTTNLERVLAPINRYAETLS